MSGRVVLNPNWLDSAFHFPKAVLFLIIQERSGAEERYCLFTISFMLFLSRPQRRHGPQYYVYCNVENRCREAKWLSECHSVTSGLIKGLRVHSGLILPSLVPCPLGSTTKVSLITLIPLCASWLSCGLWDWVPLKIRDIKNMHLLEQKCLLE